MNLQLNDPRLLIDRILVNGQWRDTGNTFAVENPATGEVIARVASAGAEETVAAVAAAAAAMLHWKDKTAKERANLLRRWFELMLENQEDLARILTAEQGKVLAEARGEIAYGAAYIEWFAEEAKRIYGDTIPEPAKDRRLIVIKQPVGVVACITPWNFPNAMLTRKIAPALAAGCTVVCKPASETPLSAFALAELAQRAGFPPGVINVVSGPASVIGPVLSSHPTIRKLTFTGSTEVGKLLVAQCATTLKKTSMELGGNAPFIVFEDADLDAAIDGLMISKYRNSGQTCVCTNRVLVQDGNEGLISTEMAPFGGVKESGFGREGSKYGILDYLEIKYLCMGGI